MVGIWQLVIVLVVVLLLFGPSRLEKLGPSLGRAIRGFKKGIDGNSTAESKDDNTDADNKSDSSAGKS